jgi:hypothetical protein
VSLVTIPKPDNIAELQEVIERAEQRLHECDTILIIMQKKEGGLIWYAPDAGRIETASFLATGFLHWLHSGEDSE